MATQTQQDKPVDYTAQHNAVISQIEHLPQLSIEVCGSWLWISGDTKPKKAKWYWKPPNQHTRSRGIPMEKIREKYGSQHISGGQDDDRQV